MRAYEKTVKEKVIQLAISKDEMGHLRGSTKVHLGAPRRRVGLADVIGKILEAGTRPDDDFFEKFEHPPGAIEREN